MKTIYLVRHGQASFGSQDYDNLSDLGKTQSRILGDYLLEKSTEFDAVFSGSLKRHNETQNGAINRDTININPDWNEFDHKAITKQFMLTNNISREEFGQYQDKELLSVFSKALKSWVKADQDSSAYPESWVEFRTRVNQAFKDSIGQTQHTGLVFTSGGPISSVVGMAWEFSAEQIIKLNWTLINTGITKLLISKRGITVACVNEHHHLEKTNNNKFITYR